MNVKLVDVALPIPIPRLFTYSIPSHLEPMAKQGSMVVVPFGNKILTGVIISFRIEKPNIALKNIVDIIDLTPTIHQNDLKLAEWIAEYYGSPLGEVVKIFLPAGFSQSSKKIVSLSDLYDKSKKLSVTKSKIVQLLADQSATIMQLKKKSGIKNIYSIIS